MKKTGILIVLLVLVVILAAGSMFTRKYRAYGNGHA